MRNRGWNVDDVACRDRCADLGQEQPGQDQPGQHQPGQAQPGPDLTKDPGTGSSVAGDDRPGGPAV